MRMVSKGEWVGITITQANSLGHLWAKPEEIHPPKPAPPKPLSFDEWLALKPPGPPPGLTFDMWLEMKPPGSPAIRIVKEAAAILYGEPDADSSAELVDGDEATPGGLTGHDRANLTKLADELASESDAVLVEHLEKKLAAGEELGEVALACAAILFERGSAKEQRIALDALNPSHGLKSKALKAEVNAALGDALAARFGE